MFTGFRSFVTLLTLMALLPRVLLAADEAWPMHAVGQLSPPSQPIIRVTQGDINGDGRADLAALVSPTEDTGTLRVYINPGPAAAASNWPVVDVAKLDFPRELVAADLDGTAVAEIVTSHALAERPLQIHRAPSDADSLLEATRWSHVAVRTDDPGLVGPILAAGRIDNLPGAELVVATMEPQGRIGWLQSPPDLKADVPWKFHAIAAAGSEGPITVGDVSRDGADDIVWIDRGETTPGIHWLTNPGPADAARGKPWLHTVVGAETPTYTRLALGDLGRDGHLDVAAATSNGVIRLFVQHKPSPPGWKALPLPIQAEAKTGSALALLDIDGDERTDLVHAALEPHEAAPASLVWYRQIVLQGNPVWLVRPIHTLEEGAFQTLLPLDADADGDADLVCLLQTPKGSQTVWFENPLQP